ncbi:MAG: hypothetical protein EXS00_04800 [Phycisphaerales bacterium]|nr:hypothetical protein [Phycisphaerales bacterium]
MNTLLLAQGSGDSVMLLVALGLLGVGIALFVLELFVPTGGVLAILTVTAVVASVVAMFVHDATWGGVYLAMLLAGAPFAIVYGIKLWSATPLARRMILNSSVDQQRVGVSDDEGEDAAPTQQARATLRALIGRDGVTLTALRPVGFARIAGHRVDALAENGFIDAARTVTVIEEIDGTLKVREHTVPQ